MILVDPCVWSKVLRRPREGEESSAEDRVLRRLIEAARIANACRRKNITASAVDCLIAASAIEHDTQLLTTDQDFTAMARHSDLKLFRIARPVQHHSSD
jgi:predicted nucleic acid-binding protein